jgi:hypothetical protein
VIFCGERDLNTDIRRLLEVKRNDGSGRTLSRGVVAWAVFPRLDMEQKMP